MALVYKPILSYEAYTTVLSALSLAAKRYEEVAALAVSPKSRELFHRYSIEAAAALAQLHEERPEIEVSQC